MFTKKLENLLINEIKKHLKNIYPTTKYWNGKYSWAEMVYFRNNFTSRKTKTGFRVNDQNCILKWGGIHNFNSHELMSDGLIQLRQGELSYPIYSRISSMSKLFSFYNPDCYFILDARVALTINYFVLSKNTGDLIIPFAPSKSKGNKVKNALLKLKSKNKFKNIGTAYISYNSLILSIYNQISIPNGLPNKPEIIEMVLFSIAEEIAYSYSKSK